MIASEMVSLSAVEMKDIAQKLGNTRMVPICVVINGIARTIYLKLEGDNPTGSVKDRTAYGLLENLQEHGVLNKNSCVIESTSGNLGVALAFLCKLRGYDFIAVIDPKTTQENVARIQALGGQCAFVHEADSSGGYLLSRLAYVREACQRSPTYVWPNQYANNANPYIHATSTGPEIYRQMHGKVDAIFAAVSTGGTLAGIGRYFRSVSAATQIIAVDAVGSVIFGGPAGQRKLTGIGASQPSKFLQRAVYDHYLLVNDQEAFAFCHALRSMLSISVGGSSGAVLAACTRYLTMHPELTDVVCLCPDSGENYASSIFNYTWLEEQHITLTSDLLGAVQNIERLPASAW